MLSVYLTSYCSFAFPEVAFLSRYPLFPPCTIALGIWAEYLEIITLVCPPHKIILHSLKDWRKPSSCSSLHAGCSRRCMHRHAQPELVLLWAWAAPACGIKSSMLKMLQYFISKVSSLLCMYALTNIALCVYLVVPCASQCLFPACSVLELLWQEHGNSDVFVRGDRWMLLFILSAQLSVCLPSLSSFLGDGLCFMKKKRIKNLQAEKRSAKGDFLESWIIVQGSYHGSE